MDVIQGITANFKKNSSGWTEFLSMLVRAACYVNVTWPKSLEVHQSLLFSCREQWSGSIPVRRKAQAQANVITHCLCKQPGLCMSHGDIFQKCEKLSPAAGLWWISECLNFSDLATMMDHHSIQRHPGGCNAVAGRAKQWQSPSPMPWHRTSTKQAVADEGKE